MHLKLPDYMVKFLKDNNMPFCEVNSIDEVLPELDVLYMTRIQRERFVTAEEYANLEGNYQPTAEKMKRAKKDMLVLHPLPRVDEIAQDVTTTRVRSTSVRRASACSWPHGAAADPVQAAVRACRSS